MQKTAIFKLHGLGTKKKAIINYAFKQHTLAHHRLLRKFKGLEVDPLQQRSL